jgi:threonine synthase
LYLKDETRSPSGSNKDRATALCCERAWREGKSAITCASTGNVAASLAIGAAAVGLRAAIFVPARVSEGKLRVMLLAGATVVKVRDGYEAAFALSRAAAGAFGFYDRNTGANPVTLEGKKTVAFEIWEQLGRRAPDAVLVPVGDGTTLSAMAKGFRELMACGALDRVPRIIGVQAEGCQPLKRAWESGAPPAICPADTLADGIAVGAPISGLMALRDVRETAGGFVAVTDEKMLEAIRTLASTAGVIPEPAAAAGFAGVRPALAAGLISPEDVIVVLVTGSGLKTPQYLQPVGEAITVGGTLDEVERALTPE